MNLLLKKLLLSFVTLLVMLALAEIGCRLLDPFPYVPEWEINDTRNGALT